MTALRLTLDTRQNTPLRQDCIAPPPRPSQLAKSEDLPDNEPYIKSKISLQTGPIRRRPARHMIRHHFLPSIQGPGGGYTRHSRAFEE